MSTSEQDGLPSYMGDVSPFTEVYGIKSVNRPSFGAHRSKSSRRSCTTSTTSW